MGRHSMITINDVLKIIRLLRRSTRFVLVLFFGGGERRIKALEKILPVLEKEGKIVSDWYKGEKVYSVARRKRVKPVSMEHEIICAFLLVVFWRCRMEESEIIPERFFRGFDIVPEGGLRYSEGRGTMLVFEYCTRSNFKHGGVMKSKITRYVKSLSRMEAKFKRSITVLFVIDIDRSDVLSFVKKLSLQFTSEAFSVFDGFEERSVGSVADGDASAFPEGDRFPLDPFFFIDYRTLKSALQSHENLLQASIYFWHDGRQWNLSRND